MTVVPDPIIIGAAIVEDTAAVTTEESDERTTEVITATQAEHDRLMTAMSESVVAGGLAHHNPSFSPAAHSKAVEEQLARRPDHLSLNPRLNSHASHKSFRMTS